MYLFFYFTLNDIYIYIRLYINKDTRYVEVKKHSEDRVEHMIQEINKNNDKYLSKDPTKKFELFSSKIKNFFAKIAG